jgi:hypothetical protein
MELYFDDTLTRGLRGYAQLVTDALGLSPQCCFVQAERPATAYVALDGQFSDFPGRDVALLWDERYGWSLAVETHSGEDLIVVERCGDELLPAPRAVTRWARTVLRGGRVRPSRRRTTGEHDLYRRLRAYAWHGSALGQPPEVQVT